MKILHVLGGGAWGGGSVVVMAITRALIARGDEVWVVSLDRENSERFAAIGAKIVRSPFWLHPINPFDIVPFVQLFLLCRRERFDLVDTHTSKGGILGRFAARLAGVPRIIHHAHGFAFKDSNHRWVRKIFLALERMAAKACDGIISVSEEHRATAIAEGVAASSHVRTVLNGIDLRLFEHPNRREARRQLGVDGDELLIGVANRLAPVKAIEYAIRAMPAVVKRFPNARLVIVGEGPSEADLRREAANSGVADRIDFAGFRRNVPELLPAFDIVVQPSRWEGLSISLLEAMAAGRPLVACDVQGNRDVIEHGVNGLMVPPQDPDALASAIANLLSDPALAKRLGERAARDCRTRFSQQRMVEQTLAIYDREATLADQVLQFASTARALRN